MGWASLLDDWADPGISRGLRRRPMAWRALRSEACEPGHLAQDGLHCRSGGSHPLLHHLLDSRPPEGYGVLPLWSESHAVLGLRCGLNARSNPRHVGTFSARRSHSVGRLSRGGPIHRHCRGGGAAAVLLPKPARRVVPREAGALGWSLRLAQSSSALHFRVTAPTE